MRGWLTRGRLWLLTAAAGGSLFVLEGCDPAVRDTMLEGVGNAATTLSTTFIQAFIQSLTTDEEETATTVRAILDYLPQLIA